MIIIFYYLTGFFYLSPFCPVMFLNFKKIMFIYERWLNPPGKKSTHLKDATEKENIVQVQAHSTHIQFLSQWIYNLMKVLHKHIIGFLNSPGQLDLTITLVTQSRLEVPHDHCLRQRYYFPLSRTPNRRKPSKSYPLFGLIRLANLFSNHLRYWAWCI